MHTHTHTHTHIMLQNQVVRWSVIQFVSQSYGGHSIAFRAYANEDKMGGKLRRHDRI